MIRLDDVHAGDQLTVQDAARNVLVGSVAVDGQTLAVAAFGTWITVAMTNRNGRLVPVVGIKIVGHQPDLRFPGGDE